jgi:hypothetical protein
MDALDARRRRLAGLARAVRAAVVVPSLFALALLLIRQPEAAGFTVFGTFAHLVMVEYDPAGKARSADCAMLTLFGAALVNLGALASATIWLAVGGAVVGGFLTEFPPLARGRVAAVRTALLLSFMLAVAVPAPARSVFPYLAGWLLAGAASQPALLLLWVPLPRLHATAPGGSSHEGAGCWSWIGNADGAGAAMGLALLLTRVLDVGHAFWVVLGVLPVLCAKGTATARTFLQGQSGTVIGCLAGALLAAILGTNQVWYWLVLPFAVFASTYAASAVGLMAGQAPFAVFAVVLFCILAPQQGGVGILRVEDIALGGAVSRVVGLLRRGAAVWWSPAARPGKGRGRWAWPWRTDASRAAPKSAGRLIGGTGPAPPP